MLHVTVTQGPNVWFGAFTVLVFHIVFLSVIHSCRGQYQLIGPSQPIVAFVGEDVVLPCYLDPVMDGSHLTLEWARPDLDPRFVFVRRDGVELKRTKHPSYEGRTSVFPDELKRGNISLKLSTVKISDEGRYRCFVPDLNKHTTVQLAVGAASSPVIQKNTSSPGLVLQCNSEGWYPEPEVFWLDGEGNLLPAGPTETTRGPGDLYTVSSRVTVEKRHSSNFTCRVHQKNIKQTRETHLHVPDDFLADPGSGSSAPVIVGVVVGSIVFLLAVVFVVWRRRQNKLSNKKELRDEEKQTGDISEQEPLVKTETDRKQLQTETQTIINVDELKEETAPQTQTDVETHQRESDTAVNEGAKLQEERETESSAKGVKQNSLDKGREETRSITETAEAPDPAGRDHNGVETKSVSEDTEQQKDEEHIKEEEESADNETQDHDLMEEEPGEQLMVEGKSLNDKEKERLKNNLKRKDREVETYKKLVCRYDEQMKDKEEQINELKQQLEEEERQEDEMNPETQKIAGDKDKDVNMTDLEKKVELQRELEKRQRQLEEIKKMKINETKKLNEAQAEKEEIINKLKMMET